MANQITESFADLPFSPAAERNKSAILQQLEKLLNGSESVFEIGSGTGQHAIHFCTAMPNLNWQPSEVPGRVKVTDSVVASTKLTNIKKTLALDVAQETWPEIKVDVIYNANTAHIMSWSITRKMLIGVARALEKDGLFLMYGPFNYQGKFTSESNKNFDINLKASNPEQGIRDIEDIIELTSDNHLILQNDIEMPANNRFLVFMKE